ncbi:MAG: TRAP transporter large permease [Actinomycetia bacterium]|nr:TRAP transporter large permease [Actinomycetes bacterium]
MGVLFVLLFIGVPVAVALATVGFVGFAFISGFDSALGIIRIVPYGTFSNYSLIVIPLFVLMGNLAFQSGLSSDLFSTARTWFGRVRGGLAMAATVACGAFAAICGSSAATAATMAKVALPEMKRHGYDDGLATGALAAGGTIGIMIPPSVIFIIYGVLTGNSIGSLFLAGIFPGLLQVALYIALIAVVCLLFPTLGPSGKSTSLGEKVKSLRGSWLVLVLFALVIGGIYAGLFSPVEAAGIGAFGAFVIALARRRLTWAGFRDSLVDSLVTSAMIFFIMLGANIFGYFLAVTRMPQTIADLLVGLQVSPYVVLLIIILIYVVLGMLMDSMAMVLITVPIFYPVSVALGFDPIWFGVIIVRVCELGLVTPPVGMNLYVLKGAAGDVPMGKIWRGVAPFIGVDLVHLALLVAFPAISLLVPNLMR